MNVVIQESISRILAKDIEARSNAITDISLVLEMHSWELSSEQRTSRYSTLLDENLVKVTLTEQEQKEIIMLLKDLVFKEDELSSSLIWAIGKTLPRIGLIPLLEIIQHRASALSDEELYQLIIALGNLLFFNDLDTLNKEHERLVDQFNLVQFLEKVISMNLAEQDTSIRLRETAQGLIEAIISPC